jgi:hypothetical protein
MAQQLSLSARPKTLDALVGRIGRSSSLAIRFYSKIDIGPNPNGCHLWVACKGRYGKFKIRGHCVNAHRVAYMLAHDLRDLPELCVLHRCDIPLCCNPSHLFLGTQKDNMDDMKAKGRFVLGNRDHTKSKLAKLTYEKAELIKEIYKNGESDKYALAVQFGVSHALIWKILAGKAWIKKCSS